MAIISKEPTRQSGLDDRPIEPKAQKLQRLERELELMKRSRQTEDESKKMKIPFKWKWKLNQSKKKDAETALVLFFNKKNEIENPQFMPIYSGNMIVHKNKAYEFDPRAIWRFKIKGYPQVYCIKETDRRPIANRDGRVVYYADSAITNQDLDEIRRRGDSTESDEFLIKAALKAQKDQLKAKASWIIGGIILVVLIGALIWFLSKGPSMSRGATEAAAPTAGLIWFALKNKYG